MKFIISIRPMIPPTASKILIKALKYGSSNFLSKRKSVFHIGSCSRISPAIPVGVYMIVNKKTAPKYRYQAELKSLNTPYRKVNRIAPRIGPRKWPMPPI